MKKNVILVFGGATPEYEESCRTCANILPWIDHEKYDVYLLGITENGEWWLTNATNEEILDHYAWQKRSDNKRAVLSPDASHRGILVLEDGKSEIIPIDIACQVVPSRLGEEGCLPGLFELAGIPYVGSDVCASACGLDKAITMLFAEKCGIDIPAYYTCTQERFAVNEERAADDCIRFFEEKTGNRFPLVVKPTVTGSSIGIVRTDNKEELIRALREAYRYADNAIIEEFIYSTDVMIGLLEDKGELKVGEAAELLVDYDKVYTRDDKQSHLLKYVIPADMPQEESDKIKGWAVDLYKSLGCKGYARVDFLVTKDKKAYFNEINTNPGMDVNLTYPKSMEKAGYSFGDIVNTLLASAELSGKIR